MRRFFRSPAGQVQQFGGFHRELVVELPVLVFRPGIETPVGDGDGVLRRIGSGYEDGAGIAHPHAVGGPLMEVHALQVVHRFGRACRVRAARRVRPGPAGERPLPRRGCGRCRNRPREWGEICPASQPRCGATPARLRRAVPTPPACDNPGCAGSRTQLPSGGPENEPQSAGKHQCAGHAERANCGAYPRWCLKSTSSIRMASLS